MADENINEYEDLSIRISELPETSNVDNEDDYLILSHPTTASTSDYLTYKIHPNQLASQGVTYTAGDHININSSNVISATYDVATSSDPGLMSTSDKTKLDGIESGANNYELPIASASNLGGVKVGTGLSINVEGALSADTIPEATTTTAGLMSSSDKSKLDGVETNANYYVLPTASDTTLGGVKVGSGLSINDAILSADPIPDATTSASGLMSATDKTKLNGLSPYTLPAATTSSLGGVKVGSGLSIDNTGELSADQYQLPIASSSTLGGVKIGSGISIASDGTISTTGGGGGSSTLSGLQDVDIQSPQADQVLKYDSTNNKWINASGGGSGSSSLAGLSDVTISTPGSNQALLYDTGSASWHNAGIDYSNITNTPTLATVATSGAYADLSGTPTLATVATSGSYTDLSNTPTIPAAQVNSDWDAVSGVAQILNKPAIPDGLADLTDDVNISSPTDGQILKYDGTSSKWVNAAAPAGASALSDLTDVAISTPLNNQALLYDNTTHTWINKAVEGTVPVKGTASGDIASFETNLAAPLQSVMVDVVATGGNGTPDNPIPINGYTEANITRCGVNLFDGSKVTTTNTSNWGVSFENDNLTIEHKTAYSTGVPTIDFNLFGTFTISFTATQNNKCSLYENGSYKQLLNSGTQFTTTRGNTYFIVFSAEDNTTNIFSNVQIEMGNTASNYHPYTANTYTIAFGQTVYGGVLDVTRGKLTVTRLYKTYNGSEAWYTSGAAGGEYRVSLAEVLDNVKYPTTNDEVLSCSCNMFVGKTANQTYARNQGISYQVGTGLRIYANDYNTSDITPWKTLLSNTPLQVVYELATPFDIDLTPEVISAVVGTNNVFADCESSEVEYYTSTAGDIKEFINSNITVEDLANIEITTPSEGDTLVYDGTNSKWINGAGGGSGSAKQTAVTQAQYDALVQAGTVDPTMEYFITDGIPSSVEYYHNYSTTEHIVGSWIDGSTLYEKTIYYAGGSSGTITIPHNISNMGKCVDAFGTCHDQGYGSQHDGECDMPLPRIATDGYNVGIVGVNTTNINISVASIWGNRIQDFYITLRYTKSST